MILIGFGANLPNARYGAPRATLEAAMQSLKKNDLELSRISPWYHSAPIPASSQPWYVNGVAVVKTNYSPSQLMRLLHQIEYSFGRTRRLRDEAREIDLDLLAFGELIVEGSDDGELVLPHPRLHLRAFVLYPLRDVAPRWNHPVSRLSVSELIEKLPKEQLIEQVVDADRSS